MAAKTAFLQIRLSPEDKARIERLAKVEHLDASTWARRVLLKKVERVAKEGERRTAT